MIVNLEVEAQRKAQWIARDLSGKDDINMARAILAAIQDNGVYAGYLFATAKFSGESAGLRRQLLEIARLIANKEAVSGDELDWLTEEICSDIERLILTKQVWEQCLVYVRYALEAQAQ